MRNWTEADATNRDLYDAEYGRGLGRGEVKVLHFVHFPINCYVYVLMIDIIIRDIT